MRNDAKKTPSKSASAHQNAPLTDQAVQAQLRKLPKSDQGFIRVCTVLVDVLGRKFRYRLPVPGAQRFLRNADTPTLSGLMLECLGRLLKAPALERIRESHLRRKSRQS